MRRGDGTAWREDVVLLSFVCCLCWMRKTWDLGIFI